MTRMLLDQFPDGIRHYGVAGCVLFTLIIGYQVFKVVWVSAYMVRSAAPSTDLAVVLALLAYWIE